MLAYLHGKGVVHRSLGPSSLFLSTNQQDEAERLTVRLVDLGFAASASTLPQEEVENAMRRGASSPLSVLPMLALNDLHGLGYILLELFLSSAAAQVSTRVGTRQVSKKESVARHASHATRLRSSGPPPLLTYSLLLPHRGAGRARCGHGAHHGTAIPKAAGRGHLRGRRVRGLPRVPTHVESQAGAADQRGLASLGQPEACSGAESSLQRGQLAEGCATLFPLQASGLLAPPFERRRSQERTWRLFAQHAVVASPMGMGLDCHRTWEALALGCIVLLQDQPPVRPYVECKAAQASAGWLSGRSSQRQTMPQAAPGFGQPRPISLSYIELVSAGAAAAAHGSARGHCGSRCMGGHHARAAAAVGGRVSPLAARSYALPVAQPAVVAARSSPGQCE